MSAHSFSMWLGESPLVVASRSTARIAMLQNAGIPVEACAADLDERAIAASRPELDPGGEAKLLASAKALHVSARYPGRLVMGADQTLDVDDAAYGKVSTRAQAFERLALLSARSHRLHSAYCLARDGAIVHSGLASASLKMRQLSASFIEAYLDAAGPDVLGSVGVYEIERAGIHLFEVIDGDWFTILGLPLREVIADLRSERLLRA